MRSGSVEQVVVEQIEDVDKDKKKKRRSGRRSKQISSSSEVRVEVSKCLGNGRATNHVFTSMKQRESEINPVDGHVPVTPNVAFSSLPFHVNGQRKLEDSQLLQNQNFALSDTDGKVVSKSCSEMITCQVSSNLPMSKDFPCHQVESYAHNKYFAPHWPMDAVSDALEKGDVFKAYFHVNAHNRLEAYCKIEGVSTDILISGISFQNRAVEGDFVAVKVDPFPCWTKMKGSVASGSNSVPVEDSKLLPESNDMASTSCKGKSKVDGICEDANPNSHIISEKELLFDKVSSIDGPSRLESIGPSNHGHVHGCHTPSLASSHVGSCGGLNHTINAVRELCALISSFPLKRPTGKVLAVIERSSRRNAIVGFLDFKKSDTYRELSKRDAKKNKDTLACKDHECVQLTPNDPRFPKMIIPVQGLPDCIKKRLENGDATLETELFGARIDNWAEESQLPHASISHSFGQGGELEAQILAILFENSICLSEFSSESVAGIPQDPWEVPLEELQSRRDLRNLCIFTIDPSTATDLDDALSVERLSDGFFRVGIHIADVSYFVLPDTELDKEAQMRSNSVYMSRKKLPMLPPLLSENVGSLNPGMDRLAFSMFLDIDLAGDIVDRSIGRSVIRSCCKLSYEQAQKIIDGPVSPGSCITSVNGCPSMHGPFEWLDVVNSIRDLYEVSKILRERRFNGGALSLDCPKIGFLFDESGNPCDSMFCEQTASNMLVEEFMLLANRTAAEVICRAFPDSALLRRHPKPNVRKLREFESFCNKHVLELDASSSGQFHLSLQRIREKFKDDSTLYDILISYAARPMQLATYFCTGDYTDNESDWSHYGLAVPLYTHFTSPLRRYPDIIVHRTLVAVIEAEEIYNKCQKTLSKSQGGSEVIGKCFTGVVFEKDAAESPEGRDVLSSAALKHGVPSMELLAEVARYCNDRNLASRYVKDACDKLYMWAILKSKKVLFSEARVLGLGPRFMSIYIQKFSIERRIYYDEVEGLLAEWLETTSTLVLTIHPNRRPLRRGSPGKWRPIEDVALIISPCDLQANPCMVRSSSIEPMDSAILDSLTMSGPSETKLDPPVFPLTLRVLSTIPVALHAVGGDNGPVDIGARLYMRSYFC